MNLPPGTRLGPYEILSQLGQGGMGVVYEARDSRLKRTVAIKLLPPDLTKDSTAKQRFLQEAQAASALDHPNICTIHEINETEDGQLYLVMAHYAGETLKERIEKGPLDLGDAIDIAAQVGQGLAEAHHAGIVHRDIKPANVFVTKSGAVKILDFGLAKLAGSEGVTQTGATVGTVAYMSPEQARGQEVDHRTDIWSLGVVLYEMLAGKPPFQGENLLALSSAITSREPASLTGLSASAQPVVSKALRKPRAERYQGLTELLRDLTIDPAPTAIASPAFDIPSIAVLPFVNMSADPEQEYFCDGLAEELIDALARLEGLRVVARTSAFRFKGEAPDLREVGETLNVTTVLEGSVRKAGNRLRINAQLINSADGYHLWSERYDRTMNDVFEVQDEIARTVVERLRVKLLGKLSDSTGSPYVKKATDNLEAYELYLKGRELANRVSGPALEQAIDYFDRVIALDPDYAAAHAARANAHGWLGFNGFGPPRELYAEVRRSSDRALELDDLLSDAHVSKGRLQFEHEWDWESADASFSRALALNPNSAFAHWIYGYFLGNTGRYGESVAHNNHALDLDPLWVNPVQGKAAFAYLVDGGYDLAVAGNLRALELDPTYAIAHVTLGITYVRMGRIEEGVASIQRGSEQMGGSLFTSILADAFVKLDRVDEARAVIDELHQRAEAEYVSQIGFAWAYAAIGDIEKAFEYLEAAYEERAPMCFSAWSYEAFDPFRGDPRFDDFLRRMSFPPTAVRRAR